jgi:hypothetical protein
MKGRAALLALAMIMVLGSSAGAMAADVFATLPSYRASFKMSLVKARSDATIQSADGQMFFEWKRVCGGYSYLQKSYTDYVNGDGNVSRQELTSDSFESTDGTQYTFHFTDTMDGQMVQEFQGRGTLSPDGKGGTVDYTKPDDSSVELPAGTIFPTVYTVDILNAARKGKRSVSRNIFDGMGEDPRYDAVAFIGKEGKSLDATNALQAMVDPKGLLVGHHWWNVNLAFYTEKTVDGLPDYEMSARFYDNGVTTDLLFNYGDIVMKGDLERIEPAVDETCRSAKR